MISAKYIIRTFYRMVRNTTGIVLNTILGIVQNTVPGFEQNTVSGIVSNNVSGIVFVQKVRLYTLPVTFIIRIYSINWIKKNRKRKILRMREN